MNQRQEQEQDDSFQNQKMKYTQLQLVNQEIFSRQVKQKNFNSL